MDNGMTTAAEQHDFAVRAKANQDHLRQALGAQFDFIVCGAGAGGSVVARRLAENPQVSVLLLEAGGSDDLPAVMDPALWPANLGSERDWGFMAEPNPHLLGRAMSMSMGKVLGGGTSINVMAWARGHKADWDHYAEVARDDRWSYASTLEIFKAIEAWRGAPDPRFRGSDGLVWVAPAPDGSRLAAAMLEGAASVGVPVFESQNGAIMEGAGGCSRSDILIRDGRRHSIFRAYVHPFLDRPNLTVLTGAMITRLRLEGRRARSVDVQLGGDVLTFKAGSEIILATGALQTPKLLMLSGIGEKAELERFGLPVVVNLPGVGRNFQDHISFGCTWALREPMAPIGTGNGATLFWKSRPDLQSPDLLFNQAEFPVPSPETAKRGVPAHGWTMFAGLSQPKSRGRVQLRSSNPLDAPLIDLNALSDPRDVEAALACIKLCRDIGNSAPFQALGSSEVMPGDVGPEEMIRFAREAAVTYWHQSCTAKMGHDDLSVVDGQLRVHGVDGLRIADASVLPRVTSGNTMAPTVMVGELASRMIRDVHAI
jgi:choline dehydrogenase